MSKVNQLARSILVSIAILGAMVLSGALYVVDETQQVVITQFGEPIGKPIMTAGLYVKIPFIQNANYLEKRLIAWDGDPNQIPTRDKRYIFVDTTARWRIADPLKFMQSVGNMMGAQARLDDILDASTRDFVTSHNLIEAVRNNNRLLEREGKGEAGEEEIAATEAIERIEVGRDVITKGILDQSSKVVPQYGIELVDIRIKRIDYVEEVRRKVYERMTAERKRAAEQYRSEGQGKKAEIEGQAQKELQEIESLAIMKSQQLKGKADAQAIKIYAEAYNRDPEFYSFLRTLETYHATVGPWTTLVLTTDSDYYEYLKGLKSSD